MTALAISSFSLESLVQIQHTQLVIQLLRDVPIPFGREVILGAGVVDLTWLNELALALIGWDMAELLDHVDRHDIILIQE